jgi:hypothetical protein
VRESNLFTFFCFHFFFFSFFVCVMKYAAFSTARNYANISQHLKLYEDDYYLPLWYKALLSDRESSPAAAAVRAAIDFSILQDKFERLRMRAAILGRVGASRAWARASTRGLLLREVSQGGLKLKNSALPRALPSKTVPIARSCSGYTPSRRPQRTAGTTAAFPPRPQG